MTPELPPKSVFKSKTALAGALVAVAGALGTLSEPVSAFLASHASGILVVLGFVHIGLRFVTKGRINLFGE